jgi:hypothetical protein
MAGIDVAHENAHHLLRYPNAIILILASILHWIASKNDTIKREVHRYIWNDCQFRLHDLELSQGFDLIA